MGHAYCVTSVLVDMLDQYWRSAVVVGIALATGIPHQFAAWSTCPHSETDNIPPSASFRSSAFPPPAHSTTMLRPGTYCAKKSEF